MAKILINLLLVINMLIVSPTNIEETTNVEETTSYVYKIYEYDEDLDLLPLTDISIISVDEEMIEEVLYDLQSHGFEINIMLEFYVTDKYSSDVAGLTIGDDVYLTGYTNNFDWWAKSTILHEIGHVILSEADPYTIFKWFIFRELPNECFGSNDYKTNHAEIFARDFAWLFADEDYQYYDDELITEEIKHPKDIPGLREYILENFQVER